MVNTILAKRVNHIVAKGGNPVWPKGSKSRGFSNTFARKGQIPTYKRGKKLYFYEDELLQWIESGRKQMQAMSLQEQAAEIVHGAKRKPKGGYKF